MTKGCVMTLTQGYISNFKVTVHTYPKSVPGPFLLNAKLDLDNISHNCCPWPKDVSWPWPKVINPRSRSQCTHTKDRVRAITPRCHVGSWYYITQLYHDLDSASHHQGQGHSLHMEKFVSRLLPFTGNLDGDDTSHNGWLWHKSCCCGGICPVRTCVVFKIANTRILKSHYPLVPFPRFVLTSQLISILFFSSAYPFPPPPVFFWCCLSVA